MKIEAELPATSATPANVLPNTRNSQAPTAKKTAAQSATLAAEGSGNHSTEGAKSSSSEAAVPQALNLSFRKDSDGTTYYVLTDPQSGKIVREIPPAQLRQLGQGIEDYLKSQAALTSKKTDSRA